MKLREEIHEVKRGRVAGLVFATNCRWVLGTSELLVLGNGPHFSFAWLCHATHQVAFTFTFAYLCHTPNTGSCAQTDLDLIHIVASWCEKEMLDPINLHRVLAQTTLEGCMHSRSSPCCIVPGIEFVRRHTQATSTWTPTRPLTPL